MEVCMGKKLKMSVTSAYIEYATGNWYHRIELTNSLLLKYRYWTFTKIRASASRKKFWTSDIATYVLTDWDLSILSQLNMRKFFHGEWLEHKRAMQRKLNAQTFFTRKKGNAKISRSTVTRMLAYTSTPTVATSYQAPPLCRCLWKPNHILDNWILTIGLRMRMMPRAMPCQCIFAYCACG